MSAGGVDDCCRPVAMRREQAARCPAATNDSVTASKNPAAVSVSRTRSVTRSRCVLSAGTERNEHVVGNLLVTVNPGDLLR